MFNLDNFVVPHGFRGRGIVGVQIWRVVNKFIFNNTPQFMYSFRVFLLKLFGAKIGKKVLIRSTVDIIYPWKLTIGDYAWIGEGVILYTLAPIKIGSNTIISQFSHLCAGGHDYSKETFDLTAKGITIGNGVWVASDVYIADGVIIGNNTIIGARSSIFKSIGEDLVCYTKTELLLKRK